MAADDLDALARAARGDGAALEELLVRHLPQLHAFVHARLGPALRQRESSLDVVQSVCRELLAAPGAPSFATQDRFRAWLFTAALNKLRERHRRTHAGKRDVDREQDAGMTTLAHLLTPSQDAIGRETAVAVQAALDELSEEHREVITLARLVHLPHAVIAEVMERSELATRQLLARAMVQLTRGLRRRGIDLDAGGQPPH